MKLQTLKSAMKRRTQKGVTMIEYALIAALVAVAAVAVLATIGSDINTKFGSVASALK
jgi:pilus assembly protein Flp/PilA